MRRPSWTAIMVFLSSAAYQILCIKVPMLPAIDTLALTAVRWMLMAAAIFGIYFAFHQYLGLVIVTIQEDILGGAKVKKVPRRPPQPKPTTNMTTTTMQELDESLYEVH